MSVIEMWRTLFSKSSKEVDQSAQRILFKVFYSKVFQAAYFIVKNYSVAEDIAQETFEKAFKKIHTLKDQSKTVAWFVQIAKRTAIDYVRKQSKNKDNIIDDKDNLVENLEGNTRNVQDEVERRFLIEELSLCLNEIKPEQRRLLEMKYIEDMTYDEMALELQTTQGAIREALSRARKKVYTCLEMKWGDKDESISS
jgi:RNA polymerase sigma-70 factor (ECF subfamily)